VTSTGQSHLFSKAVGATASTTTKLVTMRKNAIKVTKATLPRLAGNFPLIIQCWLSKYLWNPINNVTMLIPKNVAPSGFPSCRRCTYGSSPEPLGLFDIVVFRRKSCVTAIPIEANAREVRSHAKNVRSV
jgi:hypothetical protein